MIARMKVSPANAAAYKALMDHVTAMVHRHEGEGVPYYAWSRSADEPDIYLVVEVYRDAAAHAAHMASEWVRESLPKSRALVDGGFDIRQYVSQGCEPVKLRHGGPLTVPP